MFQPTQADVRRFFCTVYAKTMAGQPLEAIETIASLWIDEHPEYHLQLANLDAALAQLYAADATGSVDAAHAKGSTENNPILHLSMHLSLSEQCSIDQPRGVRQAIELLTARLDSLHDAHHAAMECLGQMMWDAQKDQKAPDGNTYVDCVRRRATRI